MGRSKLITVEEQDSGMRLSRWFYKYYPNLPLAHLHKLIRTRQIKLDGKRTVISAVLEQGQVVRVPPLYDEFLSPVKLELSEKDKKMIQSLIIYKDDNIIILDKPAGLAVQGGTNIKIHIDMLLPALKFEKREDPKLVHRLDKDTSGILILARDRRNANILTRAFKDRRVQKTYWAIVNGKLPQPEMKIDAPLLKSGEKMIVSPQGQKAVSMAKELDTAGDKFSLVELKPLSGRTHQLRVHMLHVGTPIVGDDRYFTDKSERPSEIANKLYLHAYKIDLSNIYKGLVITAELPKYFGEALDFFGFRYEK